MVEHCFHHEKPINQKPINRYHDFVRIAYVAHTRFPTEKAHGYQIAQVCHALVTLGHEVTLLVPTVFSGIQGPAHAYYGLPPSFAVVTLKSFDALSSRFIPGFLAFTISMHHYGKVLRYYLAHHPFDLLYLRSPALLAPLLSTGAPVILELHTLPRRTRAFVDACNRCARVVCLTSLMRSELVAWGVRRENTIAEGDAVDLSRFSSLPSVDSAKAHWALPGGKPVAGYVGSLVTQNTIKKGIGEFLQALALLKQRSVPVFGWIVGGPPSWQAEYERRARALGLHGDDIRFDAHKGAASVPSMLHACDLCVYPAPASRHPYFVRDTSPLKLFEYLAAGKPIVCADLPPIRDVVDESIVTFCKPGDAKSLVDAIVDVLSHSERVLKKAEKGRNVVQEHSWEKRMERILRM